MLLIELAVLGETLMFKMTNFESAYPAFGATFGEDVKVAVTFLMSTFEVMLFEEAT